MIPVEIFSYFALSLVVLSYLSQIYQIIIRKSAEDISYMFAFGVIIEYSIWCWYAFSYDGILAVYCNLLSIFFISVIVLMKIYFSIQIERNKKLKIVNKLKEIRKIQVKAREV